MQIYSDVLTVLSLRGAARRLALSITEITLLPSPRLAGTGWRLELRRTNGSLATWHDCGYFLAQLYAADPGMKARSARPSMSFDSAQEFELVTDGQFILPDLMLAADPDAAESWRSIGMEVVLPVVYGTVDVHFCGGGHIVAYAGRSDQGTITYAGSDWHVRVDLWETAAGWSEDPDDPEITYDTRTPVQPYGPCRALPTRGAPREEIRAAIAAVIIAKVRAYADRHPDVILRADILRLEHELPELREKEDAARAAHAAATEKRVSSEMRLLEARESLAQHPC
jgi:hypothetical protein